MIRKDVHNKIWDTQGFKYWSQTTEPILKSFNADPKRNDSKI